MSDPTTALEVPAELVESVDLDASFEQEQISGKVSLRLRRFDQAFVEKVEDLRSKSRIRVTVPRLGAVVTFESKTARHEMIGGSPLITITGQLVADAAAA